MRRSLACILAVALAAAAPAVAQEFGADSPQVLALREAYLRAGLALPLTSFPLSLRQLREAGAAVGYVPETGAAPEAEGARYYAFLDTVFEAWLAGEGLMIEPAAPRVGADLAKAWAGRAPFVRAGLAVAADNGLFIGLEIEGRKEWDGAFYNSWNLPADGGSGQGLLFDNQILSRGTLAWEGDGVRLSLGRGPVQLGPAALKGFYPTELLPYVDAFRFFGRLGRLSFDWLFGGFYPIKSWESIGPDGDGDFQNDVINIDELWNGASPTPPFFGIHRIQYTGRRFRAAIGEQIFYARSPVYWEANDFLPVATWHGLDFYPDNMALILDFSWAAAPGLALHAMAGYDDISSDIFGVADSPVPTIDAYALAAEYAAPSLLGGLRALAQAGYTHYLWGNFDAIESHSDLLGGEKLHLARQVARYYTDDGDGILLPFSSPYGPGAAWLKLDASARPLAAWLTLSLDALILSKNTAADLVDTPYRRDPAVENAPRTLFIELGLKARAEADLGFARGFISLRPGLMAKDGAVSGALDLRAGLSFGAGDGALRRY